MGRDEDFMTTTPPPSDPYETPQPGQGDTAPETSQSGSTPPPYPGQGADPPSYPAPPPSYSGGGEPTATRPEPSSSILAAVRLMYVGAGLQALGIIFSLLTRGQLRDQFAEQQPELTQEELDTAVAVGVGGIVVIGLLAIAMWIWMAQANKRGLGWARIVATVLGGLNIAFTLFSLFQSTGVGFVVQLITIALAAAILFLLFRPDSGAYYNAVSNQPRY